MRVRRLLARALAGLGVVAATTGAGAGALRVSPVTLDLSPGQAATTLTLRNDDPAPMTIQVRVFRWTQVDGEDRLVAADDVAVSPPIGKLPPHSERLIRIVRLTAPAQSEESYRLIVDELPPPPSENGREVRMLMRQSIPLFFASAPPGAARVSWTAARTDSGEIEIRGRNDGGRRVRVSNLRLLDAHGSALIVRPGLVGYVLARSHTDWKLPAEGPAAPARLIADTDAGPADVTLAPAR